ncbi:MAG: methyltransferase regulatory domain-containing protein [Pseudomonadota bacterium]
MNDWTSGYVADIGYSYGYYTELNPLRATLALLDRGFAPPPEGPCCELGFGQGVSANIHAAASGHAWWGTDFAPGQAAFAQGLAQASGAGAHLFDQSFEEFCSRTDLPDFAFIGLHGIWSWISDENRALIVDFVRRKLKVGGLFYVGYNTHAGWAAFVPMRNLMTQFGATMVPPGVGTLQRVEQSLGFAEKLMELNPVSGRINPAVGERLKGLRGKERNYLAHEYFNRDWHPMPFDVVARGLAPAKLDFAGSATFSEHIHAMNFTPEQEAFLDAIPDVALRETTRDFMVHQQFRKDYWIKGAVPLDPTTQMALLRRQRVQLAKPPQGISCSFVGTLGETALDETLLRPLFDALADFKPATLGQLETLMAPRGMTFVQLFQTLLLLVGRGDMALARDDAAAARAKPATDRLNAAILDLAPVSSRDVPFLASPVTGGGVYVSRTHQLFLLALEQGKATADAIAEHMRHLIEAIGIRMAAGDGQPETLEVSVSRLRGEAATFLAEALPAYRALGVV